MLLLAPLDQLIPYMWTELAYSGEAFPVGSWEEVLPLRENASWLLNIFIKV